MKRGNELREEKSRICRYMFGISYDEASSSNHTRTLDDRCRVENFRISYTEDPAEGQTLKIIICG